MKEKIIIILLIILIVGLLGCLIYRPSIHDATLYDLQAIDGIGETLSNDIMVYINSNPNCNVDDLINIDGIGETKLFRIKVRYR